MHLYAGKVLKVDLTKKASSAEAVPKSWIRDYHGGWGLAVKYFMSMVSPDTDPFSEKNALVFMTGPFAGTLVPTSARICMVSRSPHTGTIFQSNAGGAFGPELKMAGYDGLIITGRSDTLVYISITDDRVEIRDASELKGTGSLDAEEQLKQEVGQPEAKTLMIGPAGENRVSFSCVNTEGYRQFGRGGAGALFGDKRLKGVICKGSGAVTVHDMAAFLSCINHHKKSSLLTADNLWAKEDGTSVLVEMVNETGAHPTRNFTRGFNDKKKNLNADAVRKVKVADRACVSCPLGCGKFTHINGFAVEGPEYETLCLAGSNCQVESMEHVIRFNRICDDMGLDTISTGAVLSLAMEMTETGRKDFGLRFGDAEEYLQAAYEIARTSTDRGRDLSMGAKRLAQKYNATDMALEIKGLEFPAYEPRANYPMGLAYATSERGACHMRAFPFFMEDPENPEEIARTVARMQNINAVKWSMGLCDFWATVDLEILADLLGAGLGEVVRPEELARSGERIWNQTRLYNNAAGFTRKDDCLPARILKQPLENGPRQGSILPERDFIMMLDTYYKIRGWDENGRPSREKLAELGLDDQAGKGGAS